jgi:hypothetical protein
MKKISYLISISIIAFAFGCEPNTATEEGKEAVKKDTIDPREGEREGEIGEESIGGYEHNQ